MGRATRWFKGLLGMKKERDPSSSSTANSVRSADKKPEKRRWSVGKSGKDSNIIPRSSDPAWLRSFVAETAAATEEEQSRHAIAVAAATAAAADAAVAAAQAAVAVVRLTSQGPGKGVVFVGSAAVKIQTVFRGYLARKALRALKGLVKLQAVVRGYLVRKRAAATLHSMQALIRAQAAVRSQRVSRYLNKENRFPPENRARRSTERFDETRSEFHSKRISATYETPMNNGLDDSPKIVEIDTIKPRSRSRRMNNVLVECGEDFCYHGMSSPLPYPLPARLSVPDSRQLQDYEWYYPADECRFSTAQSTPRFASFLRPNAPATPAKSVCGDSFFQPYANSPNYMSSTQSFKAKLRSHSAPKQRPGLDPVGPKKRLSLNEIMASRNSISGVRMQRSCSHLHEVLNY